MKKIDYIKKEQKVLDSVLMNILRKIAEYKDGINFNKDCIKLILEHFKEEGYSDAKSSITEMMGNKNSLDYSEQNISILEKNLERPYFGKIELNEKGDIYISETLHVGMFNGGYKIVTWKDSNDESPGIVKIYYSSNVVPKDVSWVGGKGKKINDTVVGKLQIDSIRDIAANKVHTIFMSPRDRDYIDLYFIIKSGNFSLNQLILDAKIKFDWHIDKLTLVSQLLRVKEIKVLETPKIIVPFINNNILVQVQDSNGENKI